MIDDGAALIHKNLPQPQKSLPSCENNTSFGCNQMWEETLTQEPKRESQNGKKTAATSSKPVGEPFECAHFPEGPTRDVCQMTKTRAQDAKATSEARRWDFTSNLTRRNDHRNALTVQNGYSCWIQKVSMLKQKMRQTQHRFFRRFLPPFQKPGRVHTDSSRCLQPCVPRTYHGLTMRRPFIVQKQTWIAERAVRQVKGGTTKAMVQSGLPEEWWDCAVVCY